MEETLRENRKIVYVNKKLGLENVLPVMGPLPLIDTQQMGIVVCILLRSLNEGHCQNALQFEPVRRMRSLFLNAWHVSSNTLTTSVLARGVRKHTSPPFQLTLYGLNDLWSACINAWELRCVKIRRKIWK